MRKSRVRRKLDEGRAVLCTKINTSEPVVVDIIGLLGFDCVWICREHTGADIDRLAHLLRAAAMNGLDSMVRTAKGSYSDYIQPLELGASGLMIPHCMDAEEARRVVWNTRFHPLGRRPLDGGNSDGRYCMIPTAEYMELANRNTFVLVQVEDPEAVERVDEIAAVEGIDCLFVGPGDLSQGYGVPGRTDHPCVVKAIEAVAAACARHGRNWGLPVSPESAPRYLEMGARFLACGADVLALTAYFRKLRADFEKVGIEFAPVS